MHPYQHAATHPDRLAFVVADSGESLTYRELDEGSNRLAHLLRSIGLQPGDRIAIMLKNTADFPLLYWAAQRSGLFMALLSTHLKPAEAAYIVNDSGARALFFSTAVGETPAVLLAQRETLIPAITHCFDVGDSPLPGAQSLWRAAQDMPVTPIADQVGGYHFLYSSGTTGRPKGIMHKFTPGLIEALSPTEGGTQLYERFDPLVTFNAGPVYHGAPLSSMLVTQRLGGTFVTLYKFDALAALRAIQEYQVCAAQFVPTMFVRMLALPNEVRSAADTSSLKYVLHAAAPCAVGIKRQMIDWWGPIIDEYYGATENIGATYIRAAEWLEKPGSVGRSLQGAMHICDEAGNELPPGEDGILYFEVAEGRGSDYLNDADKTSSSRHPQHPEWATVGDVGHLDEDGYLFLTDRKDFTIISGGVNIYPQAIEDTLILHPCVLDVAVIGIPNPEFGEEVKAIVQPLHWEDAGDELRRQLDDWCHERISAITCPRSYQFVEELPRLPSGKLAKKELRKLFGGDAPWTR
ncbi:acyl-CoA synthetase [Mangrovimicrobium sediminis]|uniref:Acyl-CoA synthetase n=1 Tax=Mangrovimicrobium sediminis TaxID=2562682 RepID=A0A4Z0M1J3_9GAMM|nr:AMP-binding protein [Haliea sp. SAOS-164]TGD73304.1 acyl-CoA synthetase [Haliea sp. SAOS-164]